MSSPSPTDSPTTAQKKRDWRSAKLAEEIWRLSGFDTVIDETLINSWVNPHRRLQDEDYIPHLTYAEPPSDGYWDVPISPNAKHYTVFEMFHQSLPDAKRLPMEFERLSQFFTKHSSPIEHIWSNDRPSAVVNYKPPKFMKADFFQYTLTRRGHDYVRTQADFPHMNPEEVFLIAKVFQNKAEKHPKMKTALDRVNNFLRETVCDFAKIDVDIYPIISKKFDLPPLDPAPMPTEGFADRSLGATNFPELGIIFKRKTDNVKYFIPISAMNRLPNKQLDICRTAVERSKHTTAEVKFEITRRITWLENVRKFWWILIKFLKLDS